jgi:hypothetical protein
MAFVSEGARHLPGLSALIKPWQGEWPIVLHPLAGKQPSIRSNAGGCICEAHGIVDQEFVFAHKHEQRWQLEEIGEDRRHEWLARIRFTCIIGCPKREAMQQVLAFMQRED